MDLTHSVGEYSLLSAFYLVRKGDLYFKITEYDNALRDYNIAIEKEQEDDYPFSLPDFLLKRGQCYQALHEDTKARVDFTTAEELRKKILVILIALLFYHLTFLFIRAEGV